MPKEITELDKALRMDIADVLPKALRAALKTYKDHCCKPKGFPDMKEFSAHHSACKMAVTHMESLLKLAKHAYVEAGEEEQIQALIADAEDFLANMGA